MSSKEHQSLIDNSCGVVNNDDIELKQDHEAKRAAVFRDDLLFKQPDSFYLGDCPICFLPLPVDESKSTMHACCFQIICCGCEYASLKNCAATTRCPFCRDPIPRTRKEAAAKIVKKLSKTNDPNALRTAGEELGLAKGKLDVAVKYYKMAAAKGDVVAHYELGRMYEIGQGVKKDKKLEIFHMEEAAIAGHERARYHLAAREWENDREDRAVKHMIIAGKLGSTAPMEEIRGYYRDGLISKDEFASILRAHQAAVNSMKSPQREEATRDPCSGENCRAKDRKARDEARNVKDEVS